MGIGMLQMALAQTSSGGYAANGIDFDGTDAVKLAGQGFTCVGSKTFLMGFHLYIPTALPGSTEWIMDPRTNAGNRGHMRVTNTGAFQFRFENSSAASVFNRDSGVVFSANNWYNVIIAGNTASGSEVLQLYINGAQIWNSSTGVTTDRVIDSFDECIIGAQNPTTPSTFLTAYIADFYLTVEETLDITVSGNRAKFAPTFDKGSDGSNVTGTRPEMMFSGDASTWEANKGNGGTFTDHGVLTNAAASP